MLPEALFIRDGARYVPTDLARGPWHADSQHGSAMAGLLAHAVDSAALTSPMQVVRLTMDLIRAAPFAPLETQVEVRHRGKSMELVEAQLLAGSEVCARAHAVRYRVADLPAGEPWTSTEAPPPLDPAARVPLPSGERPALHNALHLSPVEGFARPCMWVRLLRPLVLGEALTPLVRVAVAFDWAYAAAQLRGAMLKPQLMAAKPFVAINTDNHIALTRPVEGEWVCLDASTLHGALGGGVTNTRIFDQRGLLGYGTQTLLQRDLDKKPKAWRD